MTKVVLLPVSRIKRPLLRRATIVLTLPLMALSCPLFALWNSGVELILGLLEVLVVTCAFLCATSWQVLKVVGRGAREILNLPGMTWRLLKSVGDAW